MSEKTYRIGLNHCIKDKPARGSGVNHATDWLTGEVTRADFIEHVRSGYAFSAHYKESYRTTENFICSDVVAADIDGALTIDEALAMPFVMDFASFIYTTPSHTEDIHRFRVVFMLDHTITKAKEWSDCLLGIALKLGGDRSIRDAGRLFYGSSNCELFDLGKTLPSNIVKDLIALGRDEKRKGRRTGAVTLPVRSKSKLSADVAIRVRNGNYAPLETLCANESVHCPVHADTKASAFVVESRNGSKGIHCRSCVMTFWAGDGDHYDFDAFDTLVEERLANDQRKREANANDPHPMAQFFPIEPSVRESQTQYLRPLLYRPGITVVKSPKGSGKTAALAALIDQIRSKNYRSDVAAPDRSKSVLLIGHRRSLIREAANRLGLDCYLDDPPGVVSHRKRFGYAICLDSLYKMRGGATYDTIIIDESEQVVSHLLAETLQAAAGTSQTFATLQWLCRSAKSIFTLDADLGLITLHALRVLRPDLWQERLTIIYNRSLDIQNKRQMAVYTSRSHIMENLLAAVRDGKRCFVTCNSKNMVHTITEVICKNFGKSRKVIAITSDNSQEENISNFIQNIQEEILNYDALICSPSLGTGIDITFPEGRCEVEAVFGFFSPFVNKHTDIDQQLSRVRNPGSVSVWFQSGGTGFETNTDVVRHQLALSNFVPSAIKDELDDDGNAVYDPQHPLLNVVTHVRVAQWASQNNIRRLFEKLRRDTGWEIAHIEKPSKLSNGRAWEEAQRSVEDRRIDEVVSAKTLSIIEYDQLAEKERRGQRLKPKERHQIERYRIERLFQEPIQRSFVVQYKGGKLEEWISNFNKVFPLTAGQDFDHTKRGITEFSPSILQNSRQWVFARTFLTSVGLMEGNSINTRKRVTSQDFDAFITLCRNNRVIIQEVFKISVRRDIHKNPVRQFNELILCLGLSLESSGKMRVQGITRETYRIDRNRMNFMGRMSTLYQNKMG